MLNGFNCYDHIRRPVWERDPACVQVDLGEPCSAGEPIVLDDVCSVILVELPGLVGPKLAPPAPHVEERSAARVSASQEGGDRSVDRLPTGAGT